MFSDSAPKAPAVARAPRRRTVRLLVLWLGAALVLAGCSSIPTVGPVGTASAQQGGEQREEAVFSPEAPTAGATAQEIIRGFMDAGTGAADDYNVARQFLSPLMVDTWSPAEQAIVYSSSRVVATADPNLFQIQLEIQSKVDGQGIRNEVPPGSTETIPVRMEKVQGEWRISDVPDGIMLTQASFPAVFTAHNLYFYSSDYEFWVPDTRWFIQRAGIAANIVNAMLVGPAPYLRGAVVSAFPAGTVMARDAVPVASGEATVDFAADSLRDSPDLNRQQMLKQLEQNLRSLNNITSVAMTEGQRPVDLGKGTGEVKNATADPSAGPTQIVVYQGELAYYDDGPRPIEGLPPVAEYGPRNPAMSVGGATIAFLDSQEDTLLATGTGQDVRVVAEGDDRFTAPSIDRKQWIWTAEASGAGSQVLAIPPGGTRETAAVPAAAWLEGLAVTELRVSRDGTRVLVAASQAGRSVILVAGIVRSPEGVPVTLTAPVPLGVPEEAGAVNRVKWASEDTVVAVQAGAQEATPVILRLGREAERLAPEEGIVGLSAGNGVEDVFIQTEAGIFNRVGSSWPLRTEGVRDPAFPG